MTEYIIDFYKNNDFVITYLVSDESIQSATKRAIQEAYFNDYNVNYYITYTEESNESQEGVVRHG